MNQPLHIFFFIKPSKNWQKKWRHKKKKVKNLVILQKQTQSSLESFRNQWLWTQPHLVSRLHQWFWTLHANWDFFPQNDNTRISASTFPPEAFPLGFLFKSAAKNNHWEALTTNDILVSRFVLLNITYCCKQNSTNRWRHRKHFAY